MLRSTPALLLKKRKSAFTCLQHRWMIKFYGFFWGQMGPEQGICFDSGSERWMSRLDRIEGEAMGGARQIEEAEQYTIERQNQMRNSMAAINQSGPMQGLSAVEMMETPVKLAPGELPFWSSSGTAHYDPESKQYKYCVRPFWWKMMPGDDGLAENAAVYHTGMGNRHCLEPTITNATVGACNAGERFLPATAEEAAEIEAEELYEREIRNSMQRAVAEMNIIEVPPFYVLGQKSWNSTMPWYKAKKAKGTLTDFESENRNWTLLASWNDVEGTGREPDEHKVRGEMWKGKKETPNLWTTTTDREAYKKNPPKFIKERKAQSAAFEAESARAQQEKLEA